MSPSSPKVTESSVTALHADIEIGAWSSPWVRLLPLWRHGIWLAAVFVLCATAVSVRLEVQQLHKDLERNGRLQREARVLNERLSLEVDARRRAAAMEQLAVQLELQPQSVVRRVR